MNPSEARLVQLVTQLKWRLQEGQGEAIYEIGVEDNGMMAGLTRGELNMSLNTLTRMAAKLGSETAVLREQVVDGCKGEDNERIVAEVLVRKFSDDQQVYQNFFNLYVTYKQRYLEKTNQNAQAKMRGIMCFAIIKSCNIFGCRNIASTK